MSGVANFLSPFSLGNLLAPVDGTTHAAKFQVELSNDAATINVASLQQSMGNFQPQSYWIDNSQNTADLLIAELTYGWSRIINAGVSVWDNFPSVPNAIFVLSSTGSINATVSLFDFPALPSSSVNINNAASSSVSIVDQPIDVEIVGGTITQATPYTDSSVTSTGASQTLASANANRKYIMIGAPSSAPVWVNFAGGTAGPNLTGCFQVQAGGFYESNLVVPSNAITCYCATAGLVIPCVTG